MIPPDPSDMHRQIMGERELSVLLRAKSHPIPGLERRPPDPPLTTAITSSTASRPGQTARTPHRGCIS